MLILALSAAHATCTDPTGATIEVATSAIQIADTRRDVRGPARRADQERWVRDTYGDDAAALFDEWREARRAVDTAAVSLIPAAFVPIFLPLEISLVVTQSDRAEVARAGLEARLCEGVAPEPASVELLPEAVSAAE